MLLGTSLVSGIRRNNGRFTDTEEMMPLFYLIDWNIHRRGIEFPGHHHVSLYIVVKMETVVKRLLLQRGISVFLSTHIEEVEMEGNKIKVVIGKRKEERVHI
ncbi:MAG: hypothetical protein QME90_09195 [Thermodesulfobacteriota bacterium]|nr:hypothetical protein [Thermodesulfobacteriota bacterium]